MALGIAKHFIFTEVFYEIDNILLERKSIDNCSKGITDRGMFSKVFQLQGLPAQKQEWRFSIDAQDGRVEKLA